MRTWIPVVRLEADEPEEQPVPVRRGAAPSSGLDDDKELRALFERTYGPIKDRGFEAFQQSRKKAPTLEQLYVTRHPCG